ncbi:MAG: dockerin type I repeat-containing protein [Bacteroidales bacterium]|nr:dockerin type I repeat-containing protein [Candidatus Sodaliphilus aphodohippi]
MKKFTLIAALLCAFCATAATSITGKYIGATLDQRGCNTANTLTIEKSGDAYTVQGFYGKNTLALNATYDESTRQLSIPGNQIILNDNGDGYEVHLVFMPDASHINGQADIVLQFDNDGNAAIVDGVGVAAVYYANDKNMIYKALYNGGFNVFKVNGTWTDYNGEPGNEPEGTSVYDVATVVNEFGGTVYGIEGFGWLNFTTNADGTVEFATNDILYYSSDYTNGRTYKYAGNNQFATDHSITGIIDTEAGTITTDPWLIILGSTTGAGATRYGAIKGYSVITLPGVTPPITVKVGDVNEDTFIDIADLNKLINVVLGIDTANQQAADVNQDTFVDIADINALINLILGI